MDPKIAVVIPTYNRNDYLTESLKALFRQTLDSNEFEIHVQVDGSTDETRATLNFFQSEHANLYFEEQKNSGASVARNKAIQKCVAPIIVFIGDDVVVEPDFLKKHLEFHEKYPEINWGCLGFTYPKKQGNENDDFVEWIHESGIQFGYGSLKPEDEVDYRYFYTSNISLKRELLEKEPFNPTFSGWGFEDSELGLRLQKKFNFKLKYWPQARACHIENFQEEKVCNRLKKSGKNLKKFQSLHPDTVLWPSRTKRRVEWLATSLLMQKIAGIFSKKWGWKLKMKRCFLEGLNLID